MRRPAPEALAAAVAVAAVLTFSASADAATGSITISGHATVGFTANVSVTKPKLAPVVRYHAGLPLVASVTGSGVVLTINPPAGGCRRLKSGVVKLTIGTLAERVTPCHRLPLLQRPLADVTILNSSVFDVTAGGIELRLSPVAGRAYSEAYPLRVSFGTKPLLTGTLHTEGSWSPPQTIWQGTDAFVNVCIDQGYETFSLNLQLYCTVPGTETGNVWITKR